jgi:hypothetical protein
MWWSKGLGSIRQLGVRQTDPPARGHLDHVRELAVKGGPAEAGSSPLSMRPLWRTDMITDAEPVDRVYVGGIERGKRNPRLLVIARIADPLSVPLTKLPAE